MGKNYWFVALLGMTLFAAENAYSQSAQDHIDRVNQILGQIQNRTGVNIPQVKSNTNPETLKGNPFAVTQTKSYSSGNQPSVQIGPANITIDLNGKSFSVPRTNQSPGVSKQLVSSGNNLRRAFAYQQFAQALIAFKKQDYQTAESQMKSAMSDLKSDPVVQQNYAMVLFQNGKYSLAAQMAYEALQSQQPFNWQTIQGLYGETGAYSKSYAALQQAAKSSPNKAEVRFLLGYHHLMLGHRQHAASEFQFVQSKLKSDPVVNALLQKTKSDQNQPPKPQK